MTVKNIFDHLDSLFPISTACDFDNAGLLIGEPEREVSKVLIALDCTLKTVASAKEKGCELIITHHPVIFEPLKSLTEGDVVYELIKSGISVISMHTNLDIADGGVTDCLCQKLGLENIEGYTAADGFILRKGSISPLSADGLAKHIKSSLGGTVKYVDGGREIKSILVCSGSGGEFLAEAIPANADALITAEVKHHQFLEAERLGISVFDGGHFNTEDVVTEPLRELLQSQFPNTEFITDHSSPIKYK